MAKSSPALSLLACNQHPSLLTSSSLHLPVTRAIPNQQQHYYRDSDVALNTRVARVSRRLEKSPSATRKPWGWSDHTILHTAFRQQQRAWNNTRTLDQLSERLLGSPPFAIRNHGPRTPRVGAARERTWAWRGPRPVAKAGCVVWVCLSPPSFM
jgi:hypothetical protein